MTLVHWDPANDLMNLHQSLDRMFGGSFIDVLPTRLGDLQPALVAPIDVHQDENGLRVEMSLPGFAPDEVTIKGEPRRLIVEAATRKAAHQRDKNCIRHERFEGRIRREIALPDGATFDKASASFENGVLKIAIPIDQAASQPKQISVQGQQPQGQLAQGNGKKATQPATETDVVGRQSQPQTAGAGG
jgi:HSP20 family protein